MGSIDLDVIYGIKLPYHYDMPEDIQGEIYEEFFEDNFPEDTKDSIPTILEPYETELYFYGIELKSDLSFSGPVDEPDISVKELILKSFEEKKIKERFYPEGFDKDIEVKIYYVPHYS
jgi:hypothetical protein